MDSSKPVAILQNDCHLHRVLWLGASVSDGEWLCCARRLSRCWQLRPLAWLGQQWHWRVAAEVEAAAVAAMEAAWAVAALVAAMAAALVVVAASTAAALAVAVSMVAALAAAASMAAWPAASAGADSVAAAWPANSGAANFAAVANFGGVGSVIATLGAAALGDRASGAPPSGSASASP